MNETLSKHGWPLGKAIHRLGTAHSNIASDLVTKIARRFAVEVKFEAYVDSNYGNLVTAVPTRISMERYTEIKYFIEGYKAATY